MRTLPLVVLVACAVAGVTGCGDTPLGAAPPTEPPYLEGEVTSVTPFTPVTEDCVDMGDLPPDALVTSDDPPSCTDPDDDRVGGIVVEEEPGVQSGNKASATVTRTTPIFMERDSEVQPATFADLAVGDGLALWFDGPVAESYPVQGEASAILILKPAP